jgi:transcriptional regulator with XRE-family HTH domain
MNSQGVAQIPNPAERARAINVLIDEHTEAINGLSALRRTALEEMLATGMTQLQIAGQLGMTRSRVSQLLMGGSKAERAFLGAGKVTVAMGAKLESGRSDPGAVVSAQAFAAFQTIANAARALGLEAVSETVPPPGLVDLNRPNLVVLTNPRLLPFLAQVMGADPFLRYANDDRGWYLMDRQTGVEYRSPRDEGENRDFGYLGRLPRPDGKGTFLYAAGLHAEGTLGAAEYLVTNISDLYKELKTKRFSMVVSCTFDPTKPESVLSTERATEIYRPEGS